MSVDISPYVMPGLSVVEITHEQILESVCEYFKIPRRVITNKGRYRDVKDARQVYMICAHLFTSTTCVKIGGLVNRDHSTVLHAQKCYTNDLSLRSKVDEFIKANKLNNKKRVIR